MRSGPAAKSTVTRPNWPTHLYNRLLGRRHFLYHEQAFTFDENVLTLRNHSHLGGYRQCEGYFIDSSATIRHGLTPPEFGAAEDAVAMDQIRQPDIRLSAARQFSSMSEYFQHQNSMLHHSADSDLKTRIPVYVPCFNNPSYLEMMVDQLVGLGFCNVVVIDNGSTFPPMLSYFEQLPESVSLIRQLQNRGPRDLFTDPTNYAQLPDHFCLTDPDLQFNPDLPATFLDDLIEATETYRIGKAGFALQISDHENMLQRKFPIGSQEYFIWEWEEQFWKTPLSRTRSGDQIYRAEVDTTFALYNKKYFDPTYPDCLKAVRIADRLACRHLPWYRDNLLTPDERDNYRATARFSVYAGAQQSELAETQSSPAVTQAAPVETARLSAERSDSATTPAAIGDTTLSRIVGPFRYLGRLVARLVDVVVRRAP